jgi:phospholipid:diacylglycerol acyltransferase
MTARRRGHRKEKHSKDKNEPNSSEVVDNRDEHLLEAFEAAKNLLTENVKSVENFINAEAEEESNKGHNTIEHHHSHKRREARVYKRWIFISSLITFAVAWILLPLIFDYKPRLDFSKFSETLFEMELFASKPGGSIFGDQIKAKLASIIKPFTPNDSPENDEQESRSPGRQLRLKGATSYFPVVMIPGVTSTGLEMWEGRSCAKSLFRQRLWGTLTMFRTLLMDKECWIEHLKLDPKTGRDPDGIRIRAAQGLEAADFLLPGFWVWARMISNLAGIGYDHNNLHMAAYDWRLDVGNLEFRDRYFTRLKSQIETMHKSQGRKVVVIAHSLGSQVWLYFQKWVEANPKESRDGIGGGGSNIWMDTHIEAFINLAGPLLGAPKSVSTILSGETRDTAQMGTLEAYLLDLMLNKQERLSLFRTWMGGFAIFPKGGTRIWGSSEKGSPDIPAGSDSNFKGIDIIKINPTTNSKENDSLNEPKSFDCDKIDKIRAMVLPSDVNNRYNEFYSDGIAQPHEISKNDFDHRKWINPLESRLPSAKNMKIYCMYGIGHETERGYVYKPKSPEELSKFTKESVDPRELILPMSIDLQEENRQNGLYKGVYHADGDATVPLLSLSYMCTHAWRNFTHLNPSGIKVIVREFKHTPSNRVTDIRGGPGSSDHVDILGNHDLTLDILKIVSNYKDPDNSDSVDQDIIFSNIKEINSKVELSF